MKMIIVGLLALNSVSVLACDELKVVDSIKANLTHQKEQFDKKFHTNLQVSDIHVGVTKNEDASFSVTYTVKQNDPQYINSENFFVIDTQFDSKCVEFGSRQVKELSF